MALGTAVFELGPESSVALDTTYLDERVRVIRGGVSDIPFVITRVAAADATAADEWRRIAACERVSNRRACSRSQSVPRRSSAARAGGPSLGYRCWSWAWPSPGPRGEGTSAGDEKLLADAAWNR